MKSRTARYGFINAKLRAGIDKILSKQFLLSLLNADDVDQLIEMLRNTSYNEAAEIYYSTGKLEEFEKRVYLEGLYLMKSIVKHVFDDAASVVKALMMKYEIENIKYVLRNLAYRLRTGRRLEESFVSNSMYIDEKIVNKINWKELIQSETIDEILNYLKDTPYFEIINPQISKFPEMNTFELEMILDRYYYSKLLKAVKELEEVDMRIAMRIIGIKIDIENIKTLIRIKRYYQNLKQDLQKFFIAGGFSINERKFKNEATTETFPGLLGEDIHTSRYLENIEKNIDIRKTTVSALEHLEISLKRIFIEESRKPLMGYPFTIGVVLAFIFLKLDEIDNLLAVVYAKVYSMEVDRIRDILM